MKKQWDALGIQTACIGAHLGCVYLHTCVPVYAGQKSTSDAVILQILSSCSWRQGVSQWPGIPPNSLGWLSIKPYLPISSSPALRLQRCTTTHELSYIGSEEPGPCACTASP